MNLLSGEIAHIYVENGMTMAQIKVRGAFYCVPLTLISEAKVGDKVLIESGVAIAKIENKSVEED